MARTDPAEIRPGEPAFIIAYPALAAAAAVASVTGVLIFVAPDVLATPGGGGAGPDLSPVGVFYDLLSLAIVTGLCFPSTFLFGWLGLQTIRRVRWFRDRGFGGLVTGGALTALAQVVIGLPIAQWGWPLGLLLATGAAAVGFDAENFGRTIWESGFALYACAALIGGLVGGGVYGWLARR